jgi:hypothetical protein
MILEGESAQHRIDGIRLLLEMSRTKQLLENVADSCGTDIARLAVRACGLD